MVRLEGGRLVRSGRHGHGEAGQYDPAARAMARLEGGDAAGFELAAGAMARLEGLARFDQAANLMAKEWQFGHQQQSKRRHNVLFQPDDNNNSSNGAAGGSPLPPGSHTTLIELSVV